VRLDMEAVLGAGAMERCGSMGMSKWTEWVQSVVDVHYRKGASSSRT
jgi:hypothetical protein